MPIQTRKVKTAQQATQKWSSRVSSAGKEWADGYESPKRNPFDPANINADGWHQGVTAPRAKERYHRNMQDVDVAVVLQTVRGAGLQKYQAAGTTKTGKVHKFMASFLPKMGQILDNLDREHPRQRRGHNRARLNAFLDAVEAERGQHA